MDSKNINPKDTSTKHKNKVEIPVEQMRPDESEESIMTPPTSQEVKAAVEELNPDENSMNSRG